MALPDGVGKIIRAILIAAFFTTELWAQDTAKPANPQIAALALPTGACAGCSPNSLIEYWRKSTRRRNIVNCTAKLFLPRGGTREPPRSFDTAFKRNSTGAPNSILKSALASHAGLGVLC